MIFLKDGEKSNLWNKTLTIEDCFIRVDPDQKLTISEKRYGIKWQKIT